MIAEVAFWDVAALQRCLRVDSRQCRRVSAVHRLRAAIRVDSVGCAAALLVQKVLLMSVVVKIAVTSVDAARRCHLKGRVEFD